MPSTTVTMTLPEQIAQQIAGDLLLQGFGRRARGEEDANLQLRPLWPGLFPGTPMHTRHTQTAGAIAAVMPNTRTFSDWLDVGG